MPNDLGSNAIKFLQNDQNTVGFSTLKQSSYTAPETITQYKIYQDSNSNQWVKEEKQVPSLAKDERVIQQFEQKIIDSSNALYQVCVPLDKKILAYDAQINALKDQIKTLSLEATSGNCWPGVACSTTTLLPTTCIIPVLNTDYATYTAIKQDVDVVSIYTKMAGPGVDYSVDNPFDPNTTVALTADYAGYGYGNTKSDDGGDTITSQGRLDISTTLSDHNARIIETQKYYTGSTITASRCVEIANTISSLQSQITAIRSQRDNEINRTDLNVVKKTKSQKELQTWDLLKEKLSSENDKSKYQETIAAIGRIS